MTVWAVLDQTKTVVNVWDDANGINPVPPNATQTTQQLSKLPAGCWLGWQLQSDGVTWWNPDQVAAANPQLAVIAQAKTLTTAQQQAVVTALNAVVVTGAVV